MFCSKCGKEISDDVKFCNFCGQPTGKEGGEQPSQSNGANGMNGANGANGTDVVGKAKEIAEAAGEKAKEAAKAVADNPTINAAGEKAKAMAGSASDMAKENYNKLDDKKKNIVKIAGAVVVLLLVVILVKACIGGGSYEQPFKDMQKLLNKKSTNVDKYVDALAPKFVSKAYKDALKVLKKSDYKDDIEDMYDDAEDELKDTFDEMKDKYGKNVKITYKITDKDKIDKDDLKDIQETYRDLGSMLSAAKAAIKENDDLSDKEATKLKKIIGDLSDDLEKVKVTKGYELDVKIKIKGKEDDDETELEDIKVIKVNGEWMIDYTSIPGLSSLTGMMGSLGSLDSIGNLLD